MKLCFNLVILVSIILISACSGNNYFGIKELESKLNSMVGQIFISSVQSAVDWKKVKENDDSFEMEKIEKNGCTYAILVNKKTSIIESWRYVSQKSVCDKNTYIPRV